MTIIVGKQTNNQLCEYDFTCVLSAEARKRVEAERRQLEIEKEKIALEARKREIEEEEERIKVRQSVQDLG